MLLVSTNVTVKPMDEAICEYYAHRSQSRVVYNWTPESNAIPCAGFIDLFEPADFNARQQLPHED